MLQGTVQIAQRSSGWDKDAGRPVLDAGIDDAIRLTKDGAVVNPRLSS